MTPWSDSFIIISRHQPAINNKQNQAARSAYVHYMPEEQQESLRDWQKILLDQSPIIKSPSMLQN